VIIVNEAGGRWEVGDDRLAMGCGGGGGWGRGKDVVDVRSVLGELLDGAYVTQIGFVSIILFYSIYFM
jgi:hypothetical protein